jgi:hypothetical protein
MDGLVPEPDKTGSVSLAALAGYTEKLNANRPASKDVTVASAVSVTSAIKDAHRYGNCEIFGYVSQTDMGEEIQFSAYCAVIGKKHSLKSLLVVFRGTDTSIAGWKEDLNMSFVNSIPSQRESVAYLEKMAASFPYPLIIAGHSKGGNLAMYASAFCNEEVQSRITDVYANDAPGFHIDVIQSDGYKAISGRIRAFIPQSSFVGMLFEHGIIPTVVRSTATGVFQHDMCTWEVTRDNFTGGIELSSLSIFVGNVVREWVGRVGKERLSKAIEVLYTILASTNANSLVDLTTDWRKAIGVVKGLNHIDKPTRKLIVEVTGEFIKAAGKNIVQRKKH